MQLNLEVAQDWKSVMVHNALLKASATSHYQITIYNKLKNVLIKQKSFKFPDWLHGGSLAQKHVEVNISALLPGCSDIWSQHILSYILNIYLQIYVSFTCQSASTCPTSWPGTLGPLLPHSHPVMYKIIRTDFLAKLLTTSLQTKHSLHI